MTRTLTILFAIAALAGAQTPAKTPAKTAAKTPAKTVAKTPAKTAALKKLTLKDLPAAVQKTVEAETKGAELKGLSKETEKGQTQYEVESVVNGKTRDFIVDAKGAVVEVEEEAAIASIPAAARAAIEKAAAGGKITRVETLTKGGVTTYEAAFTKGGRAHEVGVKADGSAVK